MKLGPRFIFNDPKTASRRRTIELATLKRKIQQRFHEKKVSPSRPVDQFIVELDLLIQQLHDVPSLSRRQHLNSSHRQYLNNSQNLQLSLDILSQLIIPSQSFKNLSIEEKELWSISKTIET